MLLEIQHTSPQLTKTVTINKMLMAIVADVSKSNKKKTNPIIYNYNNYSLRILYSKVWTQ